MTDLFPYAWIDFDRFARAAAHLAEPAGLEPDDGERLVVEGHVAQLRADLQTLSQRAHSVSGRDWDEGVPAPRGGQR